MPDVIGAPYFKKMTIHLENGNKIVINAPKVSDRNKYIQRVKLNGVEYNKTTLSHFDLIRVDAVISKRAPNPPNGRGGGPSAVHHRSAHRRVIPVAPPDEGFDGSLGRRR